jgi:integrase
MFNFAVERDILQHTPVTGVNALAPNTRRERTLSEAEIKNLWWSIDNAAMSDEISRALKLVLVTAQRPGEVTGMRSREIEGRWWTIPEERAKNEHEHRVYLTDMALALIGDTTDQDYVFPCPHEGKDQPISAHALPVAVRRNLAFQLTDKKGKPLYCRDGKPATENKLNVEKFTPHDLRRTAATFLGSMGYMDEIIDAILNHVKKGVIAIYNRHKYDNEKQAAMESWERKLLSIVTGKDPENMVSLLNSFVA